MKQKVVNVFKTVNLFRDSGTFVQLVRESQKLLLNDRVASDARNLRGTRSLNTLLAVLDVERLNFALHRGLAAELACSYTRKSAQLFAVNHKCELVGLLCVVRS